MHDLKAFIRKNKEFWKKDFKETQNGYVYIPEEANVENFYSDIVRYLSAKAIQEKKHYSIVRLTNKQENREKSQLAASFGIETQNIRQGVRVQEKVYAVIKTLLCFLCCHTGEKLLQYQIGDFSIGRCIYDKVVREQERNSIEKLKITVDFFDIYDGMLLYIRLKHIFRERPPKYLILNEMAYFLEIYRVLGQEAGGKLIRASVMLREEENVKNGFIHHSYRKLASDKLKTVEKMDYETYIDNYFARYFSGQSELSWVKNVNKDKKDLNCAELMKKLGLDEHKKNVFIMAHSLSDAPHCSEGTVYQDYYVALKETLILASKIDNVNWILKVHPSFKNYRGDNGMELVEKYGGGNIVLFDDAYSNESVFQIADAIITVQGTIGIEASSLGIPVIITGKAWYSEFGFTINAFSKKKNEQVMRKLYKIRPLSDKKRRMAMKVFCAYLQGYNEVVIDKDIFGKEIYENIVCGKTAKAKNEKAIECLLSYMEQNSLRDTWIYQKTLEYIEE